MRLEREEELVVDRSQLGVVRLVAQYPAEHGHHHAGLPEQEELHPDQVEE